MDVFISALGGALAGSAASIIATVLALRSERATSLAVARTQDVQAASSELPIALQAWMRSVMKLYGPKGDPLNDHLQETEMRNMTMLRSLQYRLPANYEVAEEIESLLQMYHDWVLATLRIADPTPEQLRLPDHISDAASELAQGIPDLARRIRRELGE